MAFGISFGKNKQSGTSTTNVNKTETTNQQQTGTKSSSGTSSTTGTSTTQSGQTSNVSERTNQTNTGTQNTQQTTTQFSEPVLSTLESAVQNLFGGLSSSPSQMDDNFDADEFVSSGVEAAQSRVNSDLENTLNSMFDQFGGRDDQNSMAALLANRARADAAASVAGVRSNLEGQAQEIERQRFLANLQGVGQQEGFLSQVLGALKGGRAAGSSATQTAEEKAGTSAGTNTQTGTSSTATSQQQVQNLVEALSQLLSGTTQTTGTEQTNQKTKSGGFGFGLSF